MFANVSNKQYIFLFKKNLYLNYLVLKLKLFLY